MAQNGSVLFPYHLSAFSSWSNQNWFSPATKTLSICPSLPFTSCDKSAACFKPNQTTPFRPATAFLKSSVSCAGRLSRNNTKWFKSFIDWVNVFFSISQKTRYQSRHMIASRLQDGKKHFRLPWYFFLHHEIWLLSLGFLPLLVLAFALYIVFYQKQILVAMSNYFPDVFFLNFFTCAFRIYNKGLSSDPH